MWKAANRDHVRQYERDRRARDPEHKKELDAAWREANRERIRRQHRAWTAAHPDRVRDNTARQRARRKPVLIVGKVERLKVWERDNGICGICKQPIVEARWHVDHIVPIARGGIHSMDNVQLAHARCNQRKGVA